MAGPLGIKHSQRNVHINILDEKLFSIIQGNLLLFISHKMAPSTLLGQNLELDKHTSQDMVINSNCINTNTPNLDFANILATPYPS